MNALLSSRFTDAALLALWEAAESADALPSGDPAIALLAAATGEATNLLERLPVGRIQARLLHLHAALFGPTLSALADCPECHNALEMVLDARELTEDAPLDAPMLETQTLCGPDWQAEVRLPRRRDIAESRSADVLSDRCLSYLRFNGNDRNFRFADIPPEAQAEVRHAMEVLVAEADPLAEIRLALTCPSCGAEWTTEVDVTAFVCAEIRAAARRLLQEIHTLARAYGWRESDILALSSRRRQQYLSLLDQEFARSAPGESSRALTGRWPRG